MKPELRLDFCSYEAARFACRRWHYRRKIPVGKLVKVGIWEGGKFVGAIIFGDALLGPKGTVYGGIDKFKVAEIVRIALREHVWPVSRMISVAITLLRQRCPGIELIVAFADQGENAMAASTKQVISSTRARASQGECIAIKQLEGFSTIAPSAPPGNAHTSAIPERCPAQRSARSLAGHESTATYWRSRHK